MCSFPDVNSLLKHESKSKLSNLSIAASPNSRNYNHAYINLVFKHVPYIASHFAVAYSLFDSTSESVLSDKDGH